MGPWRRRGWGGGGGAPGWWWAPIQSQGPLTWPLCPSLPPAQHGRAPVGLEPSTSLLKTLCHTWNQNPHSVSVMVPLPPCPPPVHPVAFLSSSTTQIPSSWLLISNHSGFGALLLPTGLLDQPVLSSTAPSLATTYVFLSLSAIWNYLAH